MGAAAIAEIAIAVIGTGASVYESNKSTAEQEKQLKIAQRQQDDAALQREVQRKQRLNAVLASSDAIAAASGVANSGSVANISIENAKVSNTNQLVDNVNRGYQIDALNSQMSSLASIGRARNYSTIMSSASNLAGTYH